MKFSRRSIINFGAGFAIAIAAGCSSQTAEVAPADEVASSPESSGEVNLYSSRHYDSDEMLYDNFEEQTGIQVNVIEGKAPELIERIKSEGENSPADVFITVDVGNLWKAEEEGLLQSVSSDKLEEAIPAYLRDEDNQWFALTKRARIIVYNKENVDPAELSTYEDLADPKWQGRICIRSSSNIYNQSLVASKIQELGEAEAQAWVEGLVANFAREPEGNDTAQIKAVASGECDLAIVNSYYVARLNRSDDPADQDIASQVDVFFPNQGQGGAHINISGAGVVANAPNDDNAVKLIEYLATPEAQKVFADGNNEYPVVGGVEANEVVKNLGDFKASDLEVETYGENNPDAIKVMDRAGWK